MIDCARHGAVTTTPNGTCIFCRREERRLLEQVVRERDPKITVFRGRSGSGMVPVFRMEQRPSPYWRASAHEVR